MKEIQGVVGACLLNTDEVRLAIDFSLTLRPCETEDWLCKVDLAILCCVRVSDASPADHVWYVPTVRFAFLCHTANNMDVVRFPGL